MGRLSDISAAYRVLGPWRLAALLGATILLILAWSALHMWLCDRTGWPDAYGFQCRRRCLFVELAHSPRLLERAGLYELALFGLLWALPAFVAAWLGCTWLKQRRRNPIKPMEPDRD